MLRCPPVVALVAVLTVASFGESKDAPAPCVVSVAILPAGFAQDSRARFLREWAEQRGVVDDDILRSFDVSSCLVQALRDGERVTLASPEAVNAAWKERAFTETWAAQPAQVAKLGEALRVDVVVIPEIRYLGVVAVDATNQPVAWLRGKLVTGLRCVEVATARVIAMRLREVAVTPPQPALGVSTDDVVQDILKRLCAQNAAQQAKDVVEAVCPIRIISLTESDGVLDRGEGWVALGDRLQVFQPGEVMVDPDTREVLGFHEARVGLLEVTRVEAYSARVRVLDGAERIQPSFICRPEPTPVSPSESGATLVIGE